ncbi:MarR family winged helix-turn-helix transcriptional regulator [Rhodovulum euryhalinum]|uniref:DNA-binding MarR family transcriptional regulator n=1 Tax=Rhodovulum euryhalinum TaxID=35805 RepID=A0A4R2KCX7_9RHOB|nr:MarR family transcriptional regulator [Rhodovulum euryhalinum]TCO70774.1 DNA-binding MarR family transcriptional regulator [Rhodovulum euryhalinum]
MARTTDAPYVLDAQVGFLMRKATQRHLSIFAAHIPDLTPTQFATLAKLYERGPTTQNALGRATAMDAATIKGVVDRLRARGLVASAPDPADCRRVSVRATAEGRRAFEGHARAAHAITRETLAPLTPAEQEMFLRLLARLG